MSRREGVRLWGRVEEGLTPHSEDLPWMTLKYMPENSGQSGHRIQKYESTDTVSASCINCFNCREQKMRFQFQSSYVYQGMRTQVQ